MTFKGFSRRAHRAGSLLLVTAFGFGSAHAACTSFGSSAADPDAAAPAPVDASQPQAEDATVVQAVPNLTIQASAEIRRGDSLKVDFTVSAPTNVPLVGDIVAGTKPAVVGITVRNVAFDAKTGKGSLEIVTEPTTKTAPANIEVSLQGPRTSNRANLKLDVLGRPGELDESFGTGGKAIVEIPDLGVRTAALDTKGNIFVAGRFFNRPDFYSRPYVAKFTPDGKLDASYGMAGRKEIVLTDSTGGEVLNIHPRADGVVAADVSLGSGSTALTGKDLAIEEHDATRIRSFRGTDFTMVIRPYDGGWLLSPHDFVSRLSPGGWGADLGTTRGSPGAPVDLVETPTHDILVGTSSDASFFGVRLTKTGTLDTTFGTNARVSLGMNGGMRPYGAALGANDMVYVLGSLDPELTMFRFSALTGQYDAAYGLKRVPVPRLLTQTLPRGFLRTEDGMYAFGTSSNIDGSGWAFVLVKFNLDGSLATDFGTSGILRLRVAPPTSFHNLGMVLLDPGGHRLVLAGYHRHVDNGDQGISLARVWR
jgi:uncharacterized delta-60 repeat protein